MNKITPMTFYCLYLLFLEVLVVVSYYLIASNFISLSRTAKSISTSSPLVICNQNISNFIGII